MLTKEDLDVLRAPFAPAEHEFLNGMAYITESAITTRIEQVDPSWQFFVDAIVRHDGVVVVTARLIVLDVTRTNTGMAQITMRKDGQAEANEAEKSATTDALKRCARLFGVGRYLLDLPASVRDTPSLVAWMRNPSGTARPQSTAKTVNFPAPAPAGKLTREQADALVQYGKDQFSMSVTDVQKALGGKVGDWTKGYDAALEAIHALVEIPL